MVRLGGTEQKTKVDPKGGQHPVWDEEFHFPVREVASGFDGRTLSVAAYSKEHKVDQLIGEGKMDISDTVVNGEFDGNSLIGYLCVPFLADIACRLGETGAEWRVSRRNILGDDILFCCASAWT